MEKEREFWTREKKGMGKDRKEKGSFWEGDKEEIKISIVRNK